MKFTPSLHGLLPAQTSYVKAPKAISCAIYEEEIWEAAVAVAAEAAEALLNQSSPALPPQTNLT